MNNKVFIAIGIFWLIIILGLVLFKEFTLGTGEEILLKTKPVDPRDLFRGDYIILNYEISTLDMTSIPTDFINITENDKIFVTLEKEEAYAIPTGIYKKSPSEGLFIKGKITKGSGNDLNVEYGIESYFVPEGKGGEIQRGAGKNLEVKVAVDKFGNAVIKSLLIDGKKISFN